ncbi:MAG: allene oxide cyclase barrel-like domain-containing protein [Streptosporangiaceae bacterium]
MGKRLGIAGAAIAVAALVVGLVTPAWGSSGNSSRHQVIRVVAITTEENFIPVTSKGPSLGDEIVISQKLLQGGTQVGHEGTVCTTVSLMPQEEAQCAATYWFGGGELTVQGLIALGSTAPYIAPITGGSASYEGAKGELHVREVTPAKGILTFDLQH